MSTAIVPASLRVPNVHYDVEQAFQSLKFGGTIVVPANVGCAPLSSMSARTRKIFTAHREVATSPLVAAYPLAANYLVENGINH